jgi:hypothetical protein
MQPGQNIVPNQMVIWLHEVQVAWLRGYRGGPPFDRRACRSHCTGRMMIAADRRLVNALTLPQFKKFFIVYLELFDPLLA